MDIASQKTQYLKKVILEQQTAWQDLIEQARSKIQLADWEGACVMYRQAFDIAEKLMCKESCGKSCAVTRYLNTAEEFAFVMKQSNFDCALALFVSQIEDSITELETELPSADLTKRLARLLSSPQQDLAMLYSDPR